MYYFFFSWCIALCIFALNFICHFLASQNWLPAALHDQLSSSHQECANLSKVCCLSLNINLNIYIYLFCTG